jgi:hypothetical protein
MMMLTEKEISYRRLRECCIYILYASYSLYHDVLIAIVSCHGLRPPNHFMCPSVIRQQDWRRPVSLVVFAYLSTRFLGQSLVYILSVLVVLKN